MKLNDLPLQQPLAAVMHVDLRALRDRAELIGRRLWRADKVAQWVVCVPEMAMASMSGGAHSPAQVCEAASRLISNALLAMLHEPEEARSGIDDLDVLVSTVSLLVPLAPLVPLMPDERYTGTGDGDCRCHALATGALRGMLSAGLCRPPLI